MKLSDEVDLLELPGSNAYFLSGVHHTLIDTGMPNNGQRLFEMLGEILPEANALDEVLLTHHDVDHIGNLYDVQEKYSAKAYISSEDMPYATGERHRPGVKRLVELALRPRLPMHLQSLEQYDNPEIKVISMPGHTLGHTIFQFREFLFTGDLFHTKQEHITPTKKIMNWDNVMLSESLDKLLDMNVEWLCPSHGYPVEFTDAIKNELKEVGAFYAGK